MERLHNSSEHHGCTHPPVHHAYPYIRLFLTGVILICTTSLLGQDCDDPKINLLKNLVSFRDHFLIKDTLENLIFSEMMTHWENNNNDYYLNPIFLQILSQQESTPVHRQENGKNYTLIRQQFIDQSFSEQELKIIRKNPVLTLMIINNVFEPTYPYLIRKTQIIDELDFYQLKAGESIAEVGAGGGSFSLILALMGCNLNLYINEISEHYVKVIKTIFEKTDQHFQLNNFECILGNETSTNIPGKVDKIIARFSFHHFDFKRKMLRSIKSNLRLDGSLFLAEIPGKFGKPNCPYEMKRRSIRRHLKRAGFTLVRELEVGPTIFFHYHISPGKRNRKARLQKNES